MREKQISKHHAQLVLTGTDTHQKTDENDEQAEEGDVGALTHP